MSDPVHIRLRKAVQHSFPKKLCGGLEKYAAIKDELVLVGDVITYRGRVLIPETL